MTETLVQRLRKRAAHLNFIYEALNPGANHKESPLLEEAAAEIERLTRELNDLQVRLRFAYEAKACCNADANAERARANAAERDKAALVAALEMIAGKRMCPDNLMGNVDIARAALATLANNEGKNDG